MSTFPRRCLAVVFAAAHIVWLTTAQPAAADWILTSLTDFNGANGQYPRGGVTLSGNTLFGTTWQGGTHGMGTVFSLPTTGGSPTTLATFDGTNGRSPANNLILSEGTLYGTTPRGGANDAGTVFAVPITGGSPTTLATFDGVNGRSPRDLVLSGNTLYGTTGGGTHGFGTVFSLPVTGGSPTTLAHFEGSNGASPSAGLTIFTDKLFGTTSSGGTNGLGTVFSLPVAGGPITTLATFDGSNGASPRAGLTLVGDTLYGTTHTGGVNNKGTVFSIPFTGGAPTTLVHFDGSNGSNPYAGLTLSGSTLYGTTRAGGANNQGTVFSLPVTGGSLTTLASFDYWTAGAEPYAGVTVSGDTLYGTTWRGGPNNNFRGVVFELSFRPFDAAPASGQTIIFNTVDRSVSVTLDRIFSITNAGEPGSVIHVTGFSFTGPDAALFDLPGFAPLALTAGAFDTIAYDLTFLGSALPGTFTATLTLFTDNGNVTYNLQATAIPEPASLGLLALASLSLLTRRRRA